MVDKLHDIMSALRAYYLLVMKDAYTKPVYPVARLHLRNGARLDRIKWRADRSEKGRAPSEGMMVNQLYGINDIEKNHEIYANDDHLPAAAITALLKNIPKAAGAESSGT